VVQQALGGHAMPVDSTAQRALERLGLAEGSIPDLRAAVERAVPKNRGAEFLELIEDLANDTCVKEEPDCSRCELRKICAYVLSHKAETPEAALANRPAKPRPAKEPAKTSKTKGAEASPASPALGTTNKSAPTRETKRKEAAPTPRSPRGKPEAK
jgi:endonuclease-3